MKLTNYIRDAFVKSAMADVPQINYNQQAEKLARKQLADMFEAIFPGVKMDHKAAEWLCSGSIDMPGDLQAIHGTRPNWECLKPTPAWKELVELSKLYREQTNKRNALSAQLRGAAYACNTTKQLRELLPEFDKYLPPEEEKTCRTLPAVANIVAEFAKAGWTGAAK
jgi:hypothetical protein